MPGPGWWAMGICPSARSYRHWSGGGALTMGARSRRQRLGTHRLFVGDSASLCAPLKKPRSADSDPLSQRRLYRRLRGSAPRVARQGRRRALGLDHRPTQGRLSDEHLCWSKRDLSAKRYVYFWADGIHGGASSVARNVFNQSRSTMAEGIGSASRAAL